MNEEVKEILDKFKIVIRNDLDYMLRTHNCKVLLDYITNLQNENEHLRTQVNTYENPDDYTLFYMWLDAKAKDKMKQLQEEKEDYKSRNEKAIEKLKYYKAKPYNEYDVDDVIIDLDYILNGGDEE